ncbi:NTF2-like N-terminal transpeptidase domain-containing protein [Paenibacillus sp. UNC499MF]|uniref:NTF2-like N-terminal transpeptidase domain-containing protein n=1 Tax=Paenibacillus sp. UNC499MF TaxID=1502751 RepID=UPI0008A01049|nr:NTF2-like N-terminal transpeptidase domain-containing protein [Paenibacillus sp. UNC499MF]SEG75890.1 NTF2-like N-terminal transpeptidase domain-containing protein [Paenibacillus sp. UNC499MF]
MKKLKLIGIISAVILLAVLLTAFKFPLAKSSSIKEEAQITLQKYVEAINKKDMDTINQLLDDRDYTDKKLQKEFYEREIQTIESLDVSIRGIHQESDEKVKIKTTVKLVENTSGETVKDHTFTMIQTAEGWKVLRLPGSQDEKQT